MLRSPGQVSVSVIQEGQGDPSDGPREVPSTHCKVDKQYPHPSTPTHVVQLLTSVLYPGCKFRDAAAKRYLGKGKNHQNHYGAGPGRVFVILSFGLMRNQGSGVIAASSRRYARPEICSLAEFLHIKNGIYPAPNIYMIDRP